MMLLEIGFASLDSLKDDVGSIRYLERWTEWFEVDEVRRPDRAH
jgi:hypothetical protein